MRFKVLFHKADEGGYWAGVPAIHGCATHRASLDEVLERLHEAVEGCLSTDSSDAEARCRNVVLEAVGVTPAELARAKLAKLGIDEDDIKKAIAWARGHL